MWVVVLGNPIEYCEADIVSTAGQVQDLVNDYLAEGGEASDIYIFNTQDRKELIPVSTPQYEFRP